jgi:hypothetical protein
MSAPHTTSAFRTSGFVRGLTSTITPTGTVSRRAQLFRAIAAASAHTITVVRSIVRVSRVDVGLPLPTGVVRITEPVLSSGVVLITMPVLSSGTVQPTPTPRAGTVIAGVPIS